MFNKKTILTELKAIKALALSCSAEFALKDFIDGNNAVFAFSEGDLTVYISKNNFKISHVIKSCCSNIGFNLCIEAGFDAFLNAVNIANADFAIKHNNNTEAFVGNVLVSAKCAVKQEPICTVLTKSFDKAEFIAAVSCMQSVPNKNEVSPQLRGLVITPDYIWATDRIILLRRIMSGQSFGDFVEVIPVLVATTIAKIASAGKESSDIIYGFTTEGYASLSWRNSIIEFKRTSSPREINQSVADIIAKPMGGADLGVSPKELSANIKAMPKSIEKMSVVANGDVAQCRFSVFKDAEYSEVGFDLACNSEKPYNLRLSPATLRKGLNSPVVSFFFSGVYLGINYADGTQGVLFMLN